MSSFSGDMSAGGPRMDPVYWLLAPAVLFLLAVFVYPFGYGLWLSLRPAAGGVFANYITFFTADNLWPTIGTTMKLALPATLINIALALPTAYRLRNKSAYQKFATTLLVLPITLGTVLIAEGMLLYFGPKGWLSTGLHALGLMDGTMRLTHNYTGVLISLIISGFPFAFLLILSHITGIDPGLPKAAATLGARPWQQFKHVVFPLLLSGLTMAFCLSFVQAFSVFPSAVLVGSPAGPTRVISIAAYEAAFERYDYSLASAIAIIMGGVQLAVVAFVLALRGMFYRGPAVGGKG